MPKADAKLPSEVERAVEHAEARQRVFSLPASNGTATPS
jgi:hypothetical protein